MRATLQREHGDDQGTYGVLDFGPELALHTLELPWRNNEHGRSRIPAGVYRVEWAVSPKRGLLLPWLREVPGRDAVQIHAGNWAGDTREGWHSDVEGCLLVGLQRAATTPPPPHGVAQKCLLFSRQALDRLARHTQGKPFELTIRDAGLAIG